MSEVHAGASQEHFIAGMKKTADIRRFQAGDERIELPPKVLETPIIPFDQSPVLWPAFASHLYSILRDTSFVKIFSLFLSLFVYKNIPFS